MENQKGITLITLVITIVVMIIIAGVATYSGIESVKSAQITAFKAELEMIQAKVNVIHEKRKNSDEKKLYYDNLGKDITQVNEEVLLQVLGESSKEGFRYFSKEDLSLIELDDIKQNVIINFDTGEVISITGIEIDGVRYYKLKDLPNYNWYEVEHVNRNVEAKEITIDQTKLSNSYRITIKDANGKDINTGSLSYKLHNSENWLLNGNNMSFIISKLGVYDIKYTDTAGNSKIHENILIGTEIFKEDFDEFNYRTNDTQIDSCQNGILSITSTQDDPWIEMYNISNFDPKENRYIEIMYNTTNNKFMELFMIEDPFDSRYKITTNLITDGNWHTALIDLWSNELIKTRENITGWRLDWGENEIGKSMQIDYIKVVKTEKDSADREEIYKEDFNEFNYPLNKTMINSCENSILDITTTGNDAYIQMYHITEFDPKEYRYIEIKYKTTNNERIDMYMIDNPTDNTYRTMSYPLVKDSEWHTITIDLWSNENVKNRDKITGWRFDWCGIDKSDVSMQIEYISVFKYKN